MKQHGCAYRGGRKRSRGSGSACAGCSRRERLRTPARRHAACTIPARTMSLAQKAARGALWTVISSVGGRAVGVVGTLVLTRFLAPEVVGEVSAAAILCMTANWISIWGFGQYTVIKGATREVAWHATVFYIALGAI